LPRIGGSAALRTWEIPMKICASDIHLRITIAGELGGHNHYHYRISNWLKVMFILAMGYYIM
jgi:hypothetical protein